MGGQHVRRPLRVTPPFAVRCRARHLRLSAPAGRYVPCPAGFPVLRRAGSVGVVGMVTAPHPNRGDGSALHFATLRSPRCRLGVARGRAASKGRTQLIRSFPGDSNSPRATPRLLR